MFKHTIEYTDFNGNQRKEDFYFHLSLPEVARIEAKIGKPINEYAQDLVNSMDLAKLLGFLEEVILSAYGKKTTDGKTFYKSKELRNEFENSQAYAELFEQMLTNPELARSFGKGVVDNGNKKKNVVKPTVVEG